MRLPESSQWLGRLALVLFFIYLFTSLFMLTFLVDDWGQINGSGQGFWRTLVEYKELWAYRPVSWVILSLIVSIFGSQFVMYMLLHLTLTAIASFILIFKVLENASQSQRKLLIVAIFSPAIASSYLFSPVNQITGGLAFLFGALGIYFFKKRYVALFYELLSVIFFSLSLCSYEYFAPLIAFFVFENISLSRKQIRFNLLTLRPFLVSLALAISWQKIFAPLLFAAEASRIVGLSSESAFSFIIFLFLTLPINLLIQPFLNPFIFSLTIISTLLIFRNSNHSFLKEKITKRALLSICLLGSLFVISGSPADQSGYYNRGLFSTWILIVIVTTDLTASKRKWLSLLMIFVLSANLSWMISRVEEAKIASDLRNNMISEIVPRAEFTKTSNTQTVLLLNSPCRLPNSESKIEIFCTSWDAKGALINSNIYFNSVGVITDRNFSIDEISNNGVDNRSYIVVRFNSSGKIVSLIEKKRFNSSDLRKEIRFAQARDGLDSLNYTRCRDEFLSAMNFDSNFGLVFRCLVDPLPNL